MTKVLYLLIIVSFLGLDSCKKKNTEPDYCASASWYTSLSTQITAVSNAATAYGLSPTTANCTALKSAYNSYINALEPFGDCSTWTAQNKAQFDAALAEARAELLTACD